MRIPATPETTEAYFERSDVVGEYTALDWLLEPERRILDVLRPSLHGGRMLDMGVGAGRTTLHFAPLVASYLGVDVSRPMVDAAAARFDDRFHRDCRFAEGDARRLPELETASFDVVLFSFNGIDLVGDHADRLACLAEMARLSRPGGAFVFSSHNLDFARRRSSVTRAAAEAMTVGLRSGARVRRSARLLRRAVAGAVRWRRLNGAPASLARVPYRLISEERPRYEFSPGFYDAPDERIQIRKYYVRPAEQVRQLRDAGFHQVRVFTPDGRECTARLEADLSEHWWLYYLCHRGPS